MTMRTLIGSRRVTARIVGLVAVVGVCLPGSIAANDSLQPAGWDEGIRLREAEDLNPDPSIVEIVLEARIALVEIAPGVRVKAWTYNGVLPGPLIRVRGGDRLVVHYTNNLPRALRTNRDGRVARVFPGTGRAGRLLPL